MSPEAVRCPLSQLERTCRERGVPLTIQRRVVIRELCEREDHPSADQPWGGLRERLPGPSRATVDPTLETLAGLGVISKACRPSPVARHDGRLEAHHHLACRSCSRRIDVEDERLDALELPATSAQGFEATDFRVQLRGTCSACRADGRGAGNRSRGERAGARGRVHQASTAPPSGDGTVQ